METTTDRRLHRLETQLRLFTRIAATLLLLLCTVFVASAFQPETVATEDEQLGRYQVFGAGSDSKVRFVVVDTRTGTVKPLGDGGYSRTNFYKTFDQMKK